MLRTFMEQFTESVNEVDYQIYRNTSSTSHSLSAPILWFVHGAGHSAHSWLLSILSCEKLFPEGTTFITYDLLDHGKTIARDYSNQSLNRHASDLKDLILKVYPAKEDLARIFLIGHSLGGAIAAEMLSNSKLRLNLFGVALIDIVEEAALANLENVKSFLTSRPSSFKSTNDAVSWLIDHRVIKNRESAEISAPTMLHKVNDSYEWIHQWQASVTYWQGWFENLSDKFLKAPCYKLLVLAGTNRLDTKLTIGQMQGKYQLRLINEAGHAIQEDAPEQLANILFQFYHHFSSTIIPT